MENVERIPLCFKAGDVIVTNYINTASTDIKVGTDVRVVEDTRVETLADKIPVYLTPTIIVHIRFRDIWKWYRNGELIYLHNTGDQNWPPINYQDLMCPE